MLDTLYEEAKKIQQDKSLTLQQKADALSVLYEQSGSDLRFVVAPGRIPHLRVVGAKNRADRTPIDPRVSR